MEMEDLILHNQFTGTPRFINSAFNLQELDLDQSNQSD